MSAAADLEVAVKEIVQGINAAAISRADRGLNIMRNAALIVLGQDGSGRTYRNGHVASAPGQPPAPDKGNLRRNWQQRKYITGKVRIVLQMKSRMFYAGFLEHGTRKMAARPFHDRIKQKALPEIQALYSNL
ncbi:MAG: hypothetical protein IKJ07_05890 [Clostridia bacterium]|nr:hypothetical protein [Clostridia bacterium]